jgi:predicted TIM-barrel fold metal-dependent hydrolase
MNDVVRGPVALPVELSHFAGRIVDSDSHEMLPAQEWVKLLGPKVKAVAEYYMKFGELQDQDKNAVNAPDYVGDVMPVDEGIAKTKGVKAPGAVNLPRRLEVMDAMGIARQIMYPSYPAVPGMRLHEHSEDPTFMPYAKGSRADREATAKQIIDVHNERLVAAAAVSARLRPAPILYGETVDELIGHAASFIKRGVRAFWLFPAGELPGGRSPAHPDLDPLWAMCAEANCAITLHTAGDGKFLRTMDWQDAPVFSGYVRHVELIRSPWFLATIHVAMENFLMAMVLGGVFERHPTLRFGVIEAGGFWVGPLMRRLDMWYQHDLGGFVPSSQQKKPYRLAEKPSFYIRRNTRMTPFVFEDVAALIEKDDLEDVVCFSTDYPHTEGGKGAAKVFYDKIAHLGPDVVEKFFVRNGAWLLPD